MARAVKANTLDDYLTQFEARLPGPMGRALRWTRQPSLIWFRVPVALLLIVGGLLSFLPILGFWMAPLGLVLLAQDVSWLQRPLLAVFQWVERHWPWSKTKRK